MALQGIFPKENNSFRFQFTEAYYKIQDCNITSNFEQLRINVAGYGDVYGRYNGGMPLYFKSFDISLTDLGVTSFDKDAIFTAAYTYLKTLDEFKDMLDV